MKFPQYRALFKNVPYSDDEWKFENQQNEKMRRTIEKSAKRYPKIYDESRMKHFPHHETRPNHGCIWGGIYYDEQSAKDACEKMIDRGAQRAEYYFYPGGYGYQIWAKSKNKDWKLVFSKEG